MTLSVRTIVLSFVMVACGEAIFAAEIRQFDLRTTERLGNELVRTSKRPDRGATTAVKKRAKETAAAAVRGKLYDGVRYDYVVLDDPEGSGFLVYALAAPARKGEVTTGGHYRVSISADGAVAKRVDLLSQLIHQPKPDASTLLAGIAGLPNCWKTTRRDLDLLQLRLSRADVCSGYGGRFNMGRSERPNC